MSEHEPYTRTALWSRRFGILSLAVLVVAVFVQRSGRVDPESSLAALISACLLALLGIGLALLAFFIIWRRGNRGAGRAVAGALAGVAVLAAPAAYMGVYWKLPSISDIATDPTAPAAFIAVAGERRPSDNALTYPAQSAAAQADFYPDISPLQTTTPVAEVYPAVLELIQKRGWRVLDDGAKGGPVRRIEAVAATPILRFLQDVVIEIRPEGSGTRVDIRSASRWGSRDFGTNARRVREFLTDLAEALG